MRLVPELMRLVPELILTALIAGVGFGVWADPSLPSALPLLLLCLGALGAAVGCRLFGIPAGPVLLAAAVIFGVWRAETAESPPLPVVPTGSRVTATVLITGRAGNIRRAIPLQGAGGGRRRRLGEGSTRWRQPIGVLVAAGGAGSATGYSLPAIWRPPAAVGQRGEAGADR